MRGEHKVDLEVGNATVIMHCAHKGGTLGASGGNDQRLLKIRRAMKASYTSVANYNGTSTSFFSSQSIAWHVAGRLIVRQLDRG